MASPALPLSTLPFRSWCPLPTFYCEKIHPVLSNLQNSVFLILYSRTTGRRSLPSCVPLNLVALAKQLKASEMGIHNAIRDLLQKGLIEQCPEKQGRSRQYKIAVSNLQSASERIYSQAQPKKLTVIKTLRRKRSDDPWPRADAQTPHDGGGCVENSNSDDYTGPCELPEFSNAEPEKEREDSHEIPPPESKQISEEQSVGTIPPNRAACPYCSPNFGETKTPQSPEFQEFERWAYPDIGRMIGAAPPPGLSNRVFAVLGDAPIEGLKKRVIRRIKAFEEYGWGLLIQLADDVRKAHEIAYKEPPRHEPKKYNPADPCTILLNGFADLLAGRVRYDLKPTRGEWVGMAGEAYDLAS